MSFKERCYTDFWYYPKWSLCYSLWIFTIMAISEGKYGWL